MGAWGSGVPEDDTALDFLAELRGIDDPMDTMREAFEAVVDAVLNGGSLGDGGLRAWTSAPDSEKAKELRTAAP